MQYRDRHISHYTLEAVWCYTSTRLHSICKRIESIYTNEYRALPWIDSRCPLSAISLDSSHTEVNLSACLSFTMGLWFVEFRVIFSFSLSTVTATRPQKKTGYRLTREEVEAGRMCLPWMNISAALLRQDNSTGDILSRPVTPTRVFPLLMWVYIEHDKGRCFDLHCTVTICCGFNRQERCLFWSFFSKIL